MEEIIVGIIIVLVGILVVILVRSWDALLLLLLLS